MVVLEQANDKNEWRKQLHYFKNFKVAIALYTTMKSTLLLLLRDILRINSSEWWGWEGE